MNNINTGDIYLMDNGIIVEIIREFENSPIITVQTLDEIISWNIYKSEFSFSIINYLGTNVDVVRLLYGDIYVV